MKNIIASFFALIISLGIQAQSNAKMQTDDKSGDGNNYCVKTDGNKIDIIYQGIPITSDVVLDNGTTVKTDGTLITKDGKTSLLRVGQCINRDGTISTSDTNNN